MLVVIQITIQIIIHLVIIQLQIIIRQQMIKQSLVNNRKQKIIKKQNHPLKKVRVILKQKLKKRLQ